LEGGSEKKSGEKSNRSIKQDLFNPNHDPKAKGKKGAGEFEGKKSNKRKVFFKDRTNEELLPKRRTRKGERTERRVTHRGKTLVPGTFLPVGP